MKKLLLLFTALLLVVTLPACDTFVSEVDDPITSASDEALNDPDQLPFATTGVFVEFAETHDVLTLAADLLSDQFRFGTNGDATFPTYDNLDSGTPQLDGNTVDGVFSALGQYRFLADRLIERVDAVNEGEGFDDAPVSETEVLFNANLHGGIARYWYAAYFGLNPREGGGVIDQSAFIPSADMYDRARSKLEAALNQVNFEGKLTFVNSAGNEVPLSYGSNAAQRQRMVNSLLARIEFNQGNYQEAAQFAQNGLQEGDTPLVTQHNDQSSNEWWNNAGRGRVQVVAADDQVNSNVPAPIVDVRSFIEIANENPQELNRIPLVGVTQDASFVGLDDPTAIEFAQDKYPSRGTPVAVISWQENHLMLAEIAQRDGDSDTALNLVNAVRASHDIDPLDSVDLPTLIAERDKELFAEGARLLDQRRVEDSILPWHLPETVGAQQTWQFLPITQQERNDNPNL